MENEKMVSHLFSHFEFCVFQFSDQRYKKAEIEREIMLHDGSIVQNPMGSTQYIVTDCIDYKLRAFQSQKDKKYTFIKPNYISNCIKANKILPLSPLYLTVLPERSSSFYRDSFDRFGDSYTNYLDLRELDELLDSMNGSYAINEQLINHITLNYRRKGKVSYCFNVPELQKVKLKMHGNSFVDSLYDIPNSIIINGDLPRSLAEEINSYKRETKNVIVEYLEDLVMAKIL
jgi:DNA ligase-4